MSRNQHYSDVKNVYNDKAALNEVFKIDVLGTPQEEARKIARQIFDKIKQDQISKANTKK